MQDKTSSHLNRKRSINDFLRAYDLVNQLDFPINVDSILGLPGESSLEMMDSLGRVTNLGPDSTTVHTLSSKNGPCLFQEQEYFSTSEVISKITDDVYRELISKGYNPYYIYRRKRTLGNRLNAGYSKEGKEPLYNMFMMDGQQSTLGFGTSGSSEFYYSESNRLEKALQYKDLRDCQERWQDKNLLKRTLMEDFKQ